MKHLFTLVFVLFTFNFASTCSCFLISDYFCPTINWAAPHLEQNPLYIVRAKVLAINGHFMDVKITENLFLEITEEEITIIGQDGLNCNQGLGPFVVDQEVILALYAAYESERYNLSGCGRFYLHIDGDNVVGPISNESNSQPYTEFRSGISECFQITDTENPSDEAAFLISPNPTRDQVQISLPISNHQSQIFLISPSGQILQKVTSEKASKTFDLSPYPAGLYFVKVIQGDKIFSKKIIKV